MICEYCGKEHDGSYGSGRFCSSKCARSFSTKNISNESRQKQIAALKNEDNRKLAIEKYREYAMIHRKRNGRVKLKTAIESGPLSDTKRKGIYGELFTASKFAEYDVPVYIPYGNSETTDLVVEINGELKKVQVKTSSVIDETNSCIHFGIANQKQRIHHKKVSYEVDTYDGQVDYLALCDIIDKRVYLLDGISLSKKGICIRKEESLSNQKKGINFADDYDIDNVLPKILELENGDDFIDVEYKEIEED